MNVFKSIIGISTVFRDDILCYSARTENMVLRSSHDSFVWTKTESGVKDFLGHHSTELIGPQWLHVRGTSRHESQNYQAEP